MKGLGSHQARRERIIQHYGGKCVDCEQTSNLVAAPVDQSWEQATGEVLSGGYAKYRWLALKAFPDGFELRCTNHREGGFNHTSQEQHEIAVLQRIQARQQVLEHYGYACAHCGNQDDSVLIPAAKQGESWVRLLGSGQTKNRDARIIRAQYPSGIELRCDPECRA
jgi:xanthine/CO dehydrogenase XdhC/CoxF family maturation factor